MTQISSLTYITYFASNTRANIPAASGAAEEVPLNTLVHLWCKSVVTFKGEKKFTFYILWQFSRDPSRFCSL